MAEVDVKRLLLELDEENRAVALLAIDEKLFVRRLRVEDITQYPVKPPIKTPMVHCPRERREVPVWWCLGSYMQDREKCLEVEEVRVNMVKGVATVKCKAQMP